MQRRRFLISTASALVLGPSVWAAEKKAAKKRGLPLGFGTYGMKTLKTEKAFEVLADIGFDAVELACFPDWDADTAKLSKERRKSLRKLLGDTGLELTAIMDRIGIAHRANHMPGQLSGGQQQRVAVARAVVGNQPLILADEPTGNLDSVHGQEVMELLRSLNKEGTTIVMVTHSPAHADYAHRTVNLFDGHIITDNTRAA